MPVQLQEFDMLTKHHMTAEALFERPGDGFRHELIAEDYDRWLSVTKCMAAP